MSFSQYTGISRIAAACCRKPPFFNRPLLVADEYYMGDCVRSYGLGIGVPADEPRTWSAAIRKLLALPDKSGRRRFQNDFSEERFEAELGVFFSQSVA